MHRKKFEGVKTPKHYKILKQLLSLIIKEKYSKMATATSEFIEVYNDDFNIDEFMNEVEFEVAKDLDSGTGKYIASSHKRLGTIKIKSPSIKTVFALSAFKEGQDPTASFSLDKSDPKVAKFTEFIEKYQAKFREHLKSKEIKTQLKLKRVLTDDALDVSFSDIIKIDPDEKYDPTLKIKFKSNNDGEFYCKFFTLNRESFEMEKMPAQKLNDRLLPRWTYINGAFVLPGMFIISNNYYPQIQIRQVGRLILPAEEGCALDENEEGSEAAATSEKKVVRDSSAKSAQEAGDEEDSSSEEEESDDDSE